MSGDANKASIWNDANVYTAPIGTANPPDELTAFSGSWALIGLLSGDNGFEEERNWDTNDYFAWGNILIRTTRKNFVLTRKFVALEDNPAVRGLVWPGSGPGTRVVPKPNNRFKIAFETIDDGLGKRRRVITRNYAEVESVGTIKDGESDLKQYEITVKIYPDANGVLFDILPADQAPTLVSLAITPGSPAVAVNGYTALVATATYSDATTRDVTAAATWTSATPSKVTVDRGYIKGVAAGSSVIQAAFGTVTASATATAS